MEFVLTKLGRNTTNIDEKTPLNMEPISPLSSSDEEAPIVEVKLKRLVECDDVNTPKRKRGRPKGSLNNNARSTISTKKQNDNDETTFLV